MGQTIVHVQREPASPDFSEDARKSHDRAIIFKHIERHHSAPHTTFFSMPGNGWHLERRIFNAANGRARFICVERDPWRIAQAMPYSIPTLRWRYGHQEISLGGFDFAIGRADDGREVLRILLLEWQTFMSLTAQDKGGSKQARREWRDQYKHWTCFWIDLSGPLNGRTLRAIRGIPMHSSPRCPAIPGVITYMVGREGADNVGQTIRYGASRADLVRQALAVRDPTIRVEVTDVWRTTGASRATMENVAVVFRRIAPMNSRTRRRTRAKRAAADRARGDSQQQEQS